MKEILYIVLEPFAEHEISYLAQAVPPMRWDHAHSPNMSIA